MADKYIRIHLDSGAANKNANELDKSLDGVDRSAASANLTMNKLAKAIGAVIAGGALVSFFKDAMQTSMGFNAAMARVGAITRATDSEFQALTRTARELGATTEFTAEQAASGLQFLGMAGFTAGDSISALPGLLDLATISALDLGTAADIASNIMSGFRIEAEKTDGVVDVLAATATRANTTVEQLGQAMSFVSPVAAAFGISIEEVSAGIGVLSDAGIQGMRAGTGLRAVFSHLANPTKKTADVLKTLGLTMDDVNPSANSLSEIINTLANTGIDANQALKLVGVEAAPALLSLVAGNDKLKTLGQTLTDVEGEAKKMAATFRDTLGGDVKTLNSAYQDLQLTMGNIFNDDARDAVQSLTEATRFIAENMQSVLDVIEVLAVAFGTRLAVALGASAVAFAQQTAASLRATTTMNAYGQVVARTTVLTNSMALATRAASAGMALLGGPVGIIAIAAASFLTYSNNADRAADVTRHLAGEVDNLTVAQAKQQRLNLSAVMEEQITATERLERKVQSLAEKMKIAENHGNELVRATLPGLRKQFEEANVELEVSRENLEKLAQKYMKLGQVVKGVKLPVSEDAPVASSPIETAGSVDETGDESVAFRLEATTEAMRVELEKRRQLRKLHGALVVAQDGMIWDQQNARAEYEYQKGLVDEDARYSEDKARRDARFAELLADDDLKESERLLIKQQWDQQTEIAKKIHEENMTQIEADAANARIQLAKAERAAKLSMLQSSGQEMMSLFAGQSRTMFEIGKGAAIASATVKGYDAAVAAWDAGMSTGGPWAPAVAAAYTAASLLKTGSQIKSIKSTKFGSGGGGSSSGGGSGISISPPSAANSSQRAPGQPAASETQQQPQQMLNISIHGGSFGNNADQFIDDLKSRINEGDLILIEPDSRNGRDILQGT